MTYAGMTLRNDVVPGDVLVRVHSVDSESIRGIVLSNDVGATHGAVLDADGVTYGPLPASALVLIYRVSG